MTAFEFLSVALSFVLGLAVTLVLTSLLAAFLARRETKLDWLPFTWAAYVLVYQFQYWWAIFELSSFPEWTGELNRSTACTEPSVRATPEDCWTRESGAFTRYSTFSTFGTSTNLSGCRYARMDRRSSTSTPKPTWPKPWNWHVVFLHRSLTVPQADRATNP